METIIETKSPANKPTGVPIRRYVGTFSDFRRLVRESILEIEKKAHSCDHRFDSEAKTLRSQ
jgi:hypothetical protein